MKMKTYAIILATVSLLASAIQTRAISSASAINSKPVFASPIEYIGTAEPPEAESASLLQAIGEFETKGTKGGFAALEDFLRAYPASTWAPSIEVNLAENY